MKLQDYIHYYIGCKCVTLDGIGTLVGIPWHIHSQDRVSVHFGKQMIKTVNSIDGGYNKIRNHGDYALSANRYEPIGSKGITEDGFDMPGGIKLILRKVGDFKEGELNEYQSLVGQTTDGVHSVIIRYDTPESFNWLLKKGFDLFDLCEAGLAIESKTLK